MDPHLILSQHLPHPVCRLPAPSPLQLHGGPPPPVEAGQQTSRAGTCGTPHSPRAPDTSVRSPSTDGAGPNLSGQEALIKRRGANRCNTAAGRPPTRALQMKFNLQHHLMYLSNIDISYRDGSSARRPWACNDTGTAGHSITWRRSSTCVCPTCPEWAD